jgi:hypothetical protein
MLYYITLEGNTSQITKNDICYPYVLYLLFLFMLCSYVRVFPLIIKGSVNVIHLFGNTLLTLFTLYSNVFLCLEKIDCSVRVYGTLDFHPTVSSDTHTYVAQVKMVRFTLPPTHSVLLFS